MKSNFEERRQNRLEAFKNLSAKNVTLSVSSYERSNVLADCIPFGQPILVGHHSEKRHRKHIDKIHSAMNASVEAQKKADYYAQRAKSIENGNAISSDDPNCIEKLETKLKGLEAIQELMKDCNKIIKSKKTDAEKIAEMILVGLKEKYALQIMQPDFCGRIGFPSYKITNNGATIRNTKQRIEYLQKMQAIESSEEEINGITLVISQEDNRVQILFPSKPDEEIRKKLKSNGFHFCYENSAWQRQLNSYAIYLAKQIIAAIN